MVSAAADALPPCPCDWDRNGGDTIAPRFTERGCAASLLPGQIHLWTMDIDLSVDVPATTSPTDTPMALLSAAELARASRLRKRTRRAMYLGGRIGMRRLLSAYTGIANRRLRFGYGARGKPVLANALPGGELCFNYSLSGAKALYALAWNRQVGVDLECLPRKVNAASLAQRKLSAAERRAWRALPHARQTRAMLACWTRKEAYGKALGVGIRYTLNQAPVCADLSTPVWQCEVRGLFDGNGDDDGGGGGATQPGARVLHGIQLLLPFNAAAALVYDGDALKAPDGGESLRAWHWRD